MTIDLAGLKICFIAGTLGAGGAERQLYYILRALKNCGAALRLLTLTRGEFWEQPILDLGVPITWVGQSPRRVARLARIVTELRSNVPQLIQSQHFYTNLYAVGAARALGIREIGAIRSDGRSELRANGALLGRLSLRAPRLLAANSHGAISWVIQRGRSPRRIRLLPNVVDTQIYQASDMVQDQSVTLLWVGRLHQLKRVDVFLRVVARVCAVATRPVKAVIAGEGPQRSALERLARDLGLGPQVVQFAGLVPDPLPAYRAADVMLLTSDWEGTPNVLLEAMACSLPVVATRAGGVAEIVRDGDTGFLAPLGDVESLARAALELVENPGLRMTMGRRGRDYVTGHHAPAILPMHLQSLYAAALA